MGNKKIVQNIKGNFNNQTYIENQTTNNFYIIPKQDDNEQISEDPIISNFILKKELFNEFKATKDSLLFLTLGGKKPENDQALIDTGFVDFLKVLLCEKKFDSLIFNDTIALIISKHEDGIKKIINARLNAVANYWKGNDIEGELKSLLQEIKNDKTIPTWIINDIAIDLRNFSHSFIENYGQKILDESSENVFFPILDRQSNNLKSNIIKFYREETLESPYCTSHTSLSYIFNDLASYYCTSLLYGSITHLLNVRALLQDLLYSLFINQKSPDICEQIVKFDILQHDDKHLEGLIRKNKNVLFEFINFRNLISSIQFLQTEENKNLAKLEVIIHFGLLLADNEFNQLSDWLFDFSQNFINGKLEFMKYNELIKKAFNQTCIRMKNNNLLDLVCKLIDSNKYGFIELGCNIFNCIRIKDLHTEQQNSLKSSIISLLNNKEFVQNNNFYEHVVICFCKNTTINFDDLIGLLKTNFESFYNTIFKLEVLDKNFDEFLFHIDRYLDKIKNSYQSKGVFNSLDLCAIIRNIISIENLYLKSDHINKILETLYPILLSNNKMFHEKCNCLSLIIYLFTKFSHDHKWKECSDYLIINKDKIIDCFEPSFFNYSSYSQLMFYYNTLIGLVTCDNELLIQNLLSVYSMNDFDKIKSLEILSIILDTSNNIFPNETIQSIIQLACNMSEEDEKDICYYSTKILCELIDSKYQKIILEQMYRLMIFANMYSRKLIVEKLMILKDCGNKRIDEILNKAKIDRNFYIKNSFS